MQELDGLARRHAAEYFRLKKQFKAAAGAAYGDTYGAPATVPGYAPSGVTTSSPSSPQGGQSQQSEEQCMEAQLEECRVVETFKLLIFPEDTFKLYLRSLTLDDLRKEFRRLAILVHPDKNTHPHAKAAFQKLYTGFLEVSQTSN